MFGTLRPQGCGLDTADRQEHRRLYCGLCQTLGQDYGQLSRALVSFDAVFLAVLAEGLSVTAAPASRTRCPMLPVVHRPTADPDSPAMRFAAAASILLADQWVADRAADATQQGALLRRLQPWGQRPVEDAHALLHTLGVDLSALRGFADQQQAAEVPGQTTPEDAAAPTARALCLVFGSIADLPGVLPDVSGPLGDLGDAAGRIIYHLDALEDLEKDALAGTFNPCLDRHGRPSAARVRACSAALDGALDDARAALQVLPWQRSRALVEDILLHRQGQAARAARQRAEVVLASAEQARLAEMQAWPAWRRLGWRLGTALLALFLWVQSAAVAFAQQPAASDPEGGKDTATPPPELPPDPPPDPGGGSSGGSDVDCSDPCSGILQTITDALDCMRGCLVCCTEGPQKIDTFCADCGSTCTGCGQSCQSCGSGCQNCGQGCQNCGSGCQNCGHCCQGCSGGGGGPPCCHGGGGGPPCCH